MSRGIFKILGLAILIVAKPSYSSPLPDDLYLNCDRYLVVVKNTFSFSNIFGSNNTDQVRFGFVDVQVDEHLAIPSPIHDATATPQKITAEMIMFPITLHRNSGVLEIRNYEKWNNLVEGKHYSGPDWFRFDCKQTNVREMRGLIDRLNSKKTSRQMF